MQPGHRLHLVQQAAALAFLGGLPIADSHLVQVFSMFGYAYWVGFSIFLSVTYSFDGTIPVR